MMMRDNNDVGGPERGEYAMVEPQIPPQACLWRRRLLKQA